MLDATVACAYQVLEKVTPLSYLSHQENEALAQQIIRYINILKRRDPKATTACRHVDQMLIVELASIEQQRLKVLVYHVKLDNII
jgi:hypothetical protein